MTAEFQQQIASIALLVADYDEAIAFYTQKLGFSLLEDTPLGGDKRWVRVAPGNAGTALLLARASTPAQLQQVGDQAAGRVFLFLQTRIFGAIIGKCWLTVCIFTKPRAKKPMALWRCSRISMAINGICCN